MMLRPAIEAAISGIEPGTSHTETTTPIESRHRLYKLTPNYHPPQLRTLDWNFLNATENPRRKNSFGQTMTLHQLLLLLLGIPPDPSAEVESAPEGAAGRCGRWRADSSSSARLRCRRWWRRWCLVGRQPADARGVRRRW